MKLIIVIILSFAVSNSLLAQTISSNFMHGGVNRTYRVYLPNNYNTNYAYPVVLNLHGYGSNGIQQQLVSNMNTIADTANFIVVYPEGTEDLTSTQFWNANYSSSVDDIGFLNTLLDTLMVNYSVDTNRFYSTGYSNGGIMSYTMACESTGRFAAVAGLAGTMSIGQYGSCSPTRSIPILHIHGTADAVVEYTGNSLLIAVDTLVEFWKQHNGHTSPPSSTAFPNSNLLDGSTAERFVYNDTNSPVHLIKVTGGRHTWPGSAVQTGWGTCMDFDASVEIWNFFNQFSLPTSTYKIPTKPLDFITIVQNPVRQNLRFSSRGIQDYQLQITNLLGEDIVRKRLERKGMQNIDISFLQPGVYIATFRAAKGQQSIKFVVQR